MAKGTTASIPLHNYCVVAIDKCYMDYYTTNNISWLFTVPLRWKWALSDIMIIGWTSSSNITCILIAKFSNYSYSVGFSSKQHLFCTSENANLASKFILMIFDSCLTPSACILTRLSTGLYTNTCPTLSMFLGVLIFFSGPDSFFVMTLSAYWKLFTYKIWYFSWLLHADRGYSIPKRAVV